MTPGRPEPQRAVATIPPVEPAETTAAAWPRRTSCQRAATGVALPGGFGGAAFGQLSAG
jgi:hypothetical protein